MEENERITLLDNESVTIDLDDGILIAKWKATHINLATAQLAIKYRLECTDNKAYPVIINIKVVSSITKDARSFLASEQGSEGIIAGAILIDSPIGSILGNFFIAINKPLRPSKIFTDELKARKWLIKYVSEN
ncbi:MAG: hypothetical protein V4608_02775 [Bacteroidota bacterium]